MEILRLIADGFGTRDMADELHLSPNTVRNHISHIFAKLGVHSRVAAVGEATRQGIISPTSDS